ncbi:MAG: hypothetical protein Ta2B_22680 [Termitinemataceae bacterium]|nr:MAG: hypothetical protein Ta2B_22680 [Termitinemataceae bacterium]
MNGMNTRFYIYPRNGICQVQFVDTATNVRLTARSTGKRNQNEALFEP